MDGNHRFNAVFLDLVVEMKNDAKKTDKWWLAILIAGLTFLSSLTTFAGGVFLMFKFYNVGGSNDIQRFAVIQCVLGVLFLVVSIGLLVRANWARISFVIASLVVTIFLCAAAAHHFFTSTTGEDVSDTFFLLATAMFVAVPAFIFLSNRAKRHFSVGHSQSVVVTEGRGTH